MPAPWISKRVADWLDRLGIQTVTLKCDNNPATLAPAQEIRRLRIESSITILQHSEEGDHLAEASVNIVKGLIRTLKSSTESKLRPEIGPSHPLIPWITEHSAQLKNSFMACVEAEQFSVWCMSLARKSSSDFLLLTAEESVAQGSTMGSTWAADHSTARRTLEHHQE